MPSYRPRAPVVEARRWNGTAEEIQSLRHWLGYAYVGGQGYGSMLALLIENRSGRVWVNPGDWIAKESDCFSVYEPELFVQKYERADT